MADVMDAKNQERAKRVAVERIVGFAKQFDEVHLNLACHAAFPLVLTPDLLYQIWAHFVPEAPWSGVARVLLSRLCRQVGYEMYEMDIAVRNLLLRELKEQFRQERLDELAEFLMDYVAQQLTEDDPDTQDLREAQEWTALAYTKPDEAARELALALSERVKQEDMREVVRLASLVETLAEPLVEGGFEPLLVYSRGMESFMHGNLEKAQAQFSEVFVQRDKVQVAGVNLDIPSELIAENSSQTFKSTDNRDVRTGIRARMMSLLERTFQPLSNLAIKRNVIILGAGESIKPSEYYKVSYDYSQTARINEVLNVTKDRFQKGDFWLGKYVNFKKGKVVVNRDIWIQNNDLNKHVLVVGATGSGKTEFFLKSAESLMSTGHLVCLDASDSPGFLGDRISNIARKVGSNLFCWGLHSSKSNGVWNFLEELEKFGTEKEIKAIAVALYGNFSETNINTPFFNRDIVWLTAILAIMVEARRQSILILNPSDLPDLIINRDAVRSLLARLPNVASRWGADLSSYFNLSDDSFGLNISFLQNMLSWFKDPDVQAICDGASGIFLLQALNGNSRQTLIISQSLAAGKFGYSLVAVMISYVMNVIYRRLKNPLHNWIPIYIVCDEAHRFKNVDYQELTSIATNAKAGIFLFCQSIDQFSEKNLEALNKCRTQIFLQRVSYKTADWLSQQLGEYQRRVVNQNNASNEQLPVLGIREITSRPDDVMPSQFSAIVRMNAASSPATKIFITDYSL